MTLFLSDLFKCAFSCISEAVDKISTDRQRRAVPLRQPSRLLDRRRSS